SEYLIDDVETAPERSAIPTKADRSASASVMQQPYSETREDDIGMTRAERTAASIPHRSAAHGLSRRVPGRFCTRARRRRNALARRCAPTVSGARPRSDHRINCRRMWAGLALEQPSRLEWGSPRPRLAPKA